MQREHVEYALTGLATLFEQLEQPQTVVALIKLARNTPFTEKFAQLLNEAAESEFVESVISARVVKEAKKRAAETQ